MTVTLDDVAKRAGVSRSAVSRTFTPGASVSTTMRTKVENAAHELGYSPNFLARSLTTRSTKLIGLVSNNFHNPIFLEVFDQFTRGLQDRGLRPLLVNLTNEKEASASVRMLRQYSVDAVIVASSTLPPGFSKAFRDAGLPVVNSFGRYEAMPEVHVLGIDDVACGRLAACELVARGYKKVAFMGGPKDATSTQYRLKGFEKELQSHSDVEWSHSFAQAYSYKAGRTEMARILQYGRHAEAYFCGDDVLSVGALTAIADKGLAVPEDVGVIGVNDMEMAGWHNINLTTIHQPFAEIIQASINLIVGMLADPNQAPEASLFPCTLVERGTLQPRL
jgi:DNA-binding LacI/PurR family transcriptional regulator